VNGHEERLMSSMMAAASGGSTRAMNMIISSDETRLISNVIDLIMELHYAS
jgi:hypothetical protein